MQITLFASLLQRRLCSSHISSSFLKQYQTTVHTKSADRTRAVSAGGCWHSVSSKFKSSTSNSGGAFRSLAVTFLCVESKNSAGWPWLCDRHWSSVVYCLFVLYLTSARHSEEDAGVRHHPHKQKYSGYYRLGQENQVSWKLKTRSPKGKTHRLVSTQSPKYTHVHCAHALVRFGAQKPLG